MLKLKMQTYWLVATILLAVGCPSSNMNRNYHPIVGDWMLRYKDVQHVISDGDWLPYLRYRFYSDDTFAQVALSGREFKGTYTIISANSVRAIYVLGPFAYLLTVTVNGDNATGTFTCVDYWTSPLEGYRDTNKSLEEYQAEFLSDAIGMNLREGSDESAFAPFAASASE